MSEKEQKNIFAAISRWRRFCRLRKNQPRIQKDTTSTTDFMSPRISSHLSACGVVPNVPKATIPRGGSLGKLYGIPVYVDKTLKKGTYTVRWVDKSLGTTVLFVAEDVGQALKNGQPVEMVLKNLKTVNKPR